MKVCYIKYWFWIPPVKSVFASHYGSTNLLLFRLFLSACFIHSFLDFLLSDIPLAYFSLFVDTVYRLFLISSLVQREGWMGTVGTLSAVNWVEPDDKKKGKKRKVYTKVYSIWVYFIFVFFFWVYRYFFLSLGFSFSLSLLVVHYRYYNFLFLGLYSTLVGIISSPSLNSRLSYDLVPSLSVCLVRQSPPHKIQPAVPHCAVPYRDSRIQVKIGAVATSTLSLARSLRAPS